MFQKVVKFWPLLLIVVFSVLLRLFKVENLMYFSYDEEIPGLVAKRLIETHHVPLIGGVTPFGFHLAPYFYWFYAAILFIGKLNPVSWGVASAVLSSLTVLLLYLVGKDLWNKKTGITASILWAFSYLANVYDRHLWALYWGPLTCLIVIYCLNKVISGVSKFILPLALAIGISVHADPSNMVFLGLVLITLVLHKKNLPRNLFIIFVSLAIFSLPLVIFDLRHNFANTKPVLSFLKAGNNHPGIRSDRLVENTLLFPRSLSRIVYTFGDNEVNKQYSYCKVFADEKMRSVPPLATAFAASILVAFALWSTRAKRKSYLLLTATMLLYFERAKHKVSRSENQSMLALLSILYYIGVQIYGTLLNGDIFEHYITGLFPVFILILAFTASLMPKKVWLILLAIFIALNVYKLTLATNYQGLILKRQAIQYTYEQVGDKAFSLDSLSTCWRYSGYRFLFAAYGREPVKSFVDPNLAYLYGNTSVASNHPNKVAAFVMHDYVPETNDFYKRYAVLKSHEQASSLFGNLEVIILDNSTNWFDGPQILKNPNVPVGIE